MSWTPPNAALAPMNAYRKHVNKKFNQSLSDTQDLQSWAVRENPVFWVDLYGYLNLQPPLPQQMTVAYDAALPMKSIPQFFNGHLMNYAENVFLANPDADAIALVGLRESFDLEGMNEEKVTWRQLRERVRTVASALKHYGINDGDRVAALASNSIWAVVLFLACAARGVIFSSINPDLGSEGCIARLRQITPRLLFADSDASYKGKRTSTVSKVDSIMAQLEVKPEVFMIPISEPVAKYSSIEVFLRRASPTDALTFKRVAFTHPLVIVYSSGTTGAPKCIVHQHGILLNLKKVSQLHSSMTTKDVVMQYTTTTWIMWQIMCGHLACGAQVICYDGSPMYPDVKQMLRILEKYKVTYFGTSPRYLLELEMAKVIPKTEFDLKSLRMVNTTGAPLSVEQYRYFYKSFPYHAHLNNTAGGTDTATTLLGCDPAGPLYFGEMTTAALGIDVDIADPITGESIKHTGASGELVVRKPFPSMPPFFFSDPGGKAYQSSYFQRFSELDANDKNADVWAQSDWVNWNPKTGGYVMHGRSDGVLNPSGIRFGSGEIYAIVEAPPFNEEIAETLCVGRRRPQDKDEVVFLFVKMQPGKIWNQDLEERVRKAIGNGLSRRHCPRFMLQVEDIPVTINGKKVEIAVKQIISGQLVKVSSTVANPGTLHSFARFRDLESAPRAPKL